MAREESTDRLYQLLGVAHAIMFGVGTAAAGAREGRVLLGLAAGLVVAGVFLAVFNRMANRHSGYRFEPVEDFSEIEAKPVKLERDDRD